MKIPQKAQKQGTFLNNVIFTNHVRNRIKDTKG